MPDLTDIITQSIDAATAEGGDAEQDVGAADATVANEPANEPAIAADADVAQSNGAQPAAAAAAATKPATADAAAAAEAADLAAELEALGLKPAMDGRENRLPYSRVVKIVTNARKKLTDQLTSVHTKALAEREGKLTAAEGRLREMDKIDQLIKTDPEQYLAMLAVVNPAYRQFVGTTRAGVKDDVAAAAATAAKPDPMPKPDAKYADGSTGYSDEGLDALLEWKARQVETRVLAKIEKTNADRFGPMEAAWKTQQRLDARRPIIRQQVQRAKDTWGDLLTQHEPEVVKYLADHPDVPFDTAIADVLVPKTRSDRTTMREDLLKELNARPGAAALTAPAAAVASRSSNEPRSIEDVIRDSIASLR